MLFNPVGRGRNTLQNYYPCFSKFCTPTALSFYLSIYLSIYCWGGGRGLENTALLSYTMQASNKSYRTCIFFLESITYIAYHKVYEEQ